MRYLSLLLVVFVALTLASPAGAKRMYEARTTVLDLHPLLKDGDLDKRMAALVTLAKSQTVVQRVAATMSSLRMSNSFEILSTLDVTPVKDTTILAITVKAESEEMAKVAADLVANEFIQYYNETMGIKSGKPGLKILEPAAARPAPRHMPWYLGQRVLEVVAVGVAIGLIIGIPIGFLIGRRARSKRPEPI
ncbi:MAG TPA: hypothetical protein VFI02_18235 [Armatimonadota bacterium]|nr:hypothetical protein [Armatimonadota bacterium]